MTFKKAIANTVSSSCFIESTDGAICFHYYKDKFFFNDGETFEYDKIDSEKFIEYMQKEYVIKYGIKEIDYAKLIKLHEKLDAGEFNPEKESFLDVISSDADYNREMIEKLIDQNKSNLVFRDEVLSACIIKYMFDQHSIKVKLANAMYLFSFVILFIVSVLTFANLSTQHIGYALILYILAFSICCLNDQYNVNLGNVNAIKYIVTFIPMLFSSYLLLYKENIIASMIVLACSFIAFINCRSNILRSLLKFFKLFNLECYK